jgi:FHS family L-fucose permease-like MFS transporter
MKKLFQLSHVESMLIQFCFFGAYFIMSFPASFVLGKLGYRNAISGSLVLVAIGLFAFISASILHQYPFFLGALFTVGTGITLLQVAANPYLSILGKPEKASQRLSLAGFLNSAGTTLAPYLASGVLLSQMDQSSAAGAIRLPYVFLGGFVLVLAGIMYALNLPSLQTEAKENEEVGQDSGSFFGFNRLTAGALALFLYVGVEVGIGSIIVGYLTSKNAGWTEVEAGKMVSIYWGMAMIGRFFGFVLGDKIPMGKLLALACNLALVFCLGLFFLPSKYAHLTLVGFGLCHSVMWPCIFPLSIQGLGNKTDKASGLLLTMVVGGALVPMLMGWLVDVQGYSLAFLILPISYAYMRWFGAVGSRTLKQPT